MKHNFSLAYPAAILGSALAAFFMFWVGIAGLGAFGLQPPPQFSNNLCLDDKLSWLREHLPESPTMLAVGSSVTWRNFDAGLVQERAGERAVPLNAAFCGLRMNQTAFTARYFLSRMPRVHDVLTIVAPYDLAECSTNSASVFDTDDVDDFIYRHSGIYRFYLRYFDPFTLLKNVWIIRTMQLRKLPLDTLTMDRYGDAPLDTDASRPDLAYGALPAIDPQCLAALHELAMRLTEARKRLIVALEPMSPVWTQQFDHDGAGIRRLTDEVRGALNGSSAILWLPGPDLPLEAAAYTDAIHLRWSAAQILSRAIIAATGVGQDPQSEARNALSK
jgi:hypothetical protein